MSNAALIVSLFILSFMLVAQLPCAAADRPGTNSDESKVPPYTLPDALVCLDGTKVTDAKIWREKRRPELLELYRSQMQGRSPGKPAYLRFDATSIDRKAVNGAATRKEITISLSSEKDGPQLHLLLYTPNGAPKPPAVFLGANFSGNHTIYQDPGITVLDQWTWDNKANAEVLATPKPKADPGLGVWPVETILKHGFAVATVSRMEIEPDYATGYKHGVRGYYLKKAGKTEFAPDDWGAIAAWAWGLSRALDYLETDPEVDAKRVVMFGHSRLGKAALWAGAEDERFAAVISNDSGEGGAAIARRWFGETTAAVNQSFPHWFNANFKQYSGNEAKMPFDSHELIALSAPRPIYVASAEDDKWADPKGEFLAAKNAEPVYKLFGKEGLGVDEMPPVNHPVGDTICYHIRTGKHDVTEFDWEQYLKFAERHLGK